MKNFLLACSLTALLAGCSVIPYQQDVLLNPRASGKAFAAVTRQASPSVVSVQTQQAVDLSILQDMPLDEEAIRRFLDELMDAAPEDGEQSEELVVDSQGSGFVFRVEEGRSYILTTNHVVEGARTIRVMLLDGREFNATIKGVDPQSDIAVLEIPTTDAKPLAQGNSTQLEVGEWVLAIGNPFGLQHTLTVGVVSAKGRTALGINDYESFIQTDAAINPGNSGGPLVNLKGEVVGMNTAIFSSSGGYMGIGFAIPIDFAVKIADQLIAGGEVIRGKLGVMLQPLQQMPGSRFRPGIMVAGVEAGSSADRAGIRENDIILSYAGKTVTDIGEFRNLVAATRPGSRLDIVILRNGASRTLSVEIGQLP